MSFIIPVKGAEDEFAVGIAHREGVIRWDRKSATAELVRISQEVEKSEEFKDNVLNDGKADRYGRLYTGTRRINDCSNLDKPTYGNLFRRSIGDSAVTMREKIRVSNGMEFDDETNTYYYIDSYALNGKLRRK